MVVAEGGALRIPRNLARITARTLFQFYSDQCGEIDTQHVHGNLLNEPQTLTNRIRFGKCS